MGKLSPTRHRDCYPLPYHVNVQDALKIRQDMSTLFSSWLTGGFHAPISNKVVTMKFKTKGVKVNGKIICDLEALFASAAGGGEQEKNGAL